MGSEKKSGWSRTRKFFNNVHLWVGLASGLIVIAVCLSGTILVFETQFREMSAPHLFTLAPSAAKPLPGERVTELVEEATSGLVVGWEIPADPHLAWQLLVRKGADGEQPRPGGPARLTRYAVNQYTGEVLGDLSNLKNGTTEFMRTMFSLHRWLLLDRVEEPIFGTLENRKLGSYITGTATILFTMGLLTGMVIWFPQKLKNWKQGLKIKWKAKWKRVNHDLHNALAFYSLIFLFLMGITGPQWSFSWYREGLQKTLGTYRPAGAPRVNLPVTKRPAVAGAKSPAVDLYIASADKVLVYPGDYEIRRFVDTTAAVTVTKRKVGFFASSGADKLLLDRYSAEVLHVDIFKDKSFNERVAASIAPLHMGDLYGTFTKILYFLACLVATTLPVTGTMIWINKLRKKSRSATKQRASDVES